MITLQDIWKDYKINATETFHALKGVSLSVDRKEFVSITGPSGCGKSTTMQIMGLLDRPTKGKVFIENKETENLSDGELSRLRNEFVGFVFQQFNLINKLTILENILVPTIYCRKKLNYNPKDLAEQYLKRFGILEKAHSYPNKISGGQQQRVAIARALIMQPSFILADEPTGNLDTKNGEEIMNLFKELNYKDGVTIVLVTHEPNIAAFANRTIKMQDGLIISNP